jgi:predicted hydrocarbon binding protein
MSSSRPHELALPAAALAALRRTLAAELGAERAADVLRRAGHSAGDALFQSLAGARGSEDLSAIGIDAFWRRLGQLFAARGWGNLSHLPLHPGVGAVESADWGEADPASEAKRPSCFFTTGVLANLLGHVAGGDVAVLEVECRSRGDHHCRFLFGSPDALNAVYDRVVEGEAADAAVAQLG